MAEGLVVDALDAVEAEAHVPAAGAAVQPRRARRRLAAAGAVLVAAIAAIAIVLLSSGSASPRSAGTGVPAGDTTSEVARRTLSEGSTIDGTLGYGSTLELYDRLGGTFTWLPSVGAIISRGGALFRIDNEPVVLMYGSVPAYRELKQGVSDGPDVSELNANLIALGDDPYGAIGERDRFGEATAAAVERWQKAEGLPETGSIELGRVIFAPSARRVTAVKVSLGQDPPGASAPSPASTTPASTTPASTTPASTTPASTTPAPAPAATAPAKSHGHAPSRPQKKSNKKSKPAKHPSSGAGNPSNGAGKTPASSKSSEGANKEQSGKGNEGGAGAGELALSTTTTQQIVQLKVKAEQQQLAHVGEVAPVLLPGGATVSGRITSVGTVASASSSESEHGAGGSNGGGSEAGESTISVTLALEHRVARLDEAPVSVELVKSVQHDALTVPATALVATAGGGYAIEVLEGARRVPLPVTPGMFAQGYVEIEGAGVRSGLTVLVPR
ncbi:MAG TPA: peptidoglycan-binding domain-containing protein [Solirubrobacteraceae bacterium]|nr:peptidoglycan-binding domain-containing protein [Solirubrobacteraceae bacterium]